MANLNLDKKEVEVLSSVLENSISDLGMEIAQTDSLQFREGLKDKKEILSHILDDLREPKGESGKG